MSTHKILCQNCEILLKKFRTEEHYGFPLVDCYCDYCKKEISTNEFAYSVTFEDKLPNDFNWENIHLLNN